MRSKSERLKVFFQRLAAAEPVSSAEEGFRLIAETLNAVEDELTDVPYDPLSWMKDQRMYPPQEDSARRVKGHSKVVRYRSRLHSTFISAWGAIEIQDVNGDVLLQKSSFDGRGVWD